MVEHRQWSDHGYVFSVVFGIVFVTSGWLFVCLLGIPTDMPLKDLLTPSEIAVFLLLLGACSVISYLVSLWISKKVRHGAGIILRNRR